MKKRISIVFLSIIIVFTAISGIVGCADNTAAIVTEKDLILYYKEVADGENRIFTNADEYDAESGIFNLTLEVEQSEYDFNAHFRAPSGQKWSLYADAEGREHIATKRVVNFKNGENLFYLVVQDRNETCQKTYVVRIDKKYLVTLTFYKRDGSVCTELGQKFNDFINGNNGRINEKNEVVLPGGTTVDRLPEYPYEKGYEFKGWLCDQFVKDEPVTKNLEFTPDVNAEKYECVLDADGGYVPTGESRVTLTFDQGVTLPVPAKSGYNFVGWKCDLLDGLFTDENGAMLAPLTKTLKDAVAVAVWQPKRIKLTFDSDGGSPVASITQDYGTEVVKPANPTKRGYTFLGWTPAVPATMPAEDKHLVAEWQINVHTIRFNSDGGSTVGSVTQEYGTAVTAPAAPVKRGYTFVRWQPAVPEVMPDEDLDLTAIWKVNVYSVTFNLEGGNIDGESEYVQSYDYGAQIAAPANPVKRGYTFKRWLNLKGEEQKFPVTMEDKNVTFTAEWQINKYKLTYVYGIEGKADVQIEKNYGDAIAEIATPVREGYTFTGWEGEKVTVMPDRDVTYTAQWIINQYTVTFDYNGITVNGEDKKVIRADYKSAIAVPDNLQRENYTFVGWRLNGAIAVPVTVMPAKDMLYVAEWRRNQSTVTFKNGDEILQVTTGDVGSALTKPQNPVKTGYTFKGWSVETDVYPENDAVIEAVWEINRHSITYKNGLGLGDRIDWFNFGQTVTPAPNPEKEGYTFTGWEPALPEIMQDEDVIVVAQWTLNEYEIVFDSDGGTPVATIKQGYGTGVTAPDDPEKTGYEFAGWQPALPETMPLNGMTVKAQWNAIVYTVTFTANQGKFPDDKVTYIERKTYGAEVNEPSVQPTRAGYTFTGWQYDGGTAVTFPFTMGADNLIIKAGWKKKLTVNLNANQGTIDGSETKLLGEFMSDVTDLQLGVPVRAYYEFVGWATSQSGTPVTGADGVCASIPGTDASEITFYAIWTPIEYTVTVNYTSGQNSWGVIKINGTVRTSIKANVTSALTFVATANDGYEFVCWTIKGRQYAQSALTLESGRITEDTFLTATFKELSGTAIGTEAELRAMTADGEYYLKNNVALTQDWTPIENFSGTFDGRGFTVSNVYFSTETGKMQNTGNKGMGFFASIASTGIVKNLNLAVNMELKTYSNSTTSQLSFGAIAGVNNGIVENCSASGSIKSTMGQFSYNIYGEYVVGGAVGHNMGRISGVKSSVTVTVNDVCENKYPVGGLSVGGVVGMHGKISDKETQGSQLIIEYCYASGTVNGGSEYYVSLFVGGVVGSAYAPVTDVKSAATVNVVCKDVKSVGAATNQVFAGGVAGIMGGEYLRRAYCSGKINVNATGNVRAAGICNAMNRSSAAVEITSAVFAGSVTASVQPSALSDAASLSAGRICGSYANKPDNMSNLFYVGNATVSAKVGDSSGDDATFTDAEAVVVKNSDGAIERQGTASASWYENDLGFGSGWSYADGAPKLDIE
ncbi:MAG: InlB B-repeat-containing protein [Candidatus Neoclostridium sp.]